MTAQEAYKKAKEVNDANSNTEEILKLIAVAALKGEFYIEVEGTGDPDKVRKELEDLGYDVYFHGCLKNHMFDVSWYKPS